MSFGPARVGLVELRLSEGFAKYALKPREPTFGAELLSSLSKIGKKAFALFKLSGPGETRLCPYFRLGPLSGLGLQA